MIRPGIEPCSPGPLANTLPTNTIYWRILTLTGLQLSCIEFA